MKIYTKKGDFGKSTLVGGRLIEKSSPLLEAYGTADELNSSIGLIMAEEQIPFLTAIQQQLFVIGGMLATDPQQWSDFWKNVDIHSFIQLIEKEIDELSLSLEPLKNFLLPQGSRAIVQCHVSRTVCRRLERRICSVYEENESYLFIMQYVNRLSDYLFILARYLHKKNNVEEIYCKSI